jgi:GTP-binding protein
VEWTELDVLVPGEPILVAHGGAGGRGNTYFASREIPGPRFCERGYPGDNFVLDLNFKTISDVGLIGLPNAGKSSFICAVTNAESKIAAYPFTTLNPYIAAIDYPDSVQVKIVDIPGLIKGANRGVGLGRSFLKHLERSKVMAYVVDVSGARPWEDLTMLREELRSYDRSMLDRPSIVIANKADVVPIAKANFEELVRVAGCEVVPVSSKYRKNLEEVARKLRSMVEKQSQRLNPPCIL